VVLDVVVGVDHLSVEDMVVEVDVVDVEDIFLVEVAVVEVDTVVEVVQLGTIPTIDESIGSCVLSKAFHKLSAVAKLVSTGSSFVFCINDMRHVLEHFD
jgi:hypothetical protein